MAENLNIRCEECRRKSTGESNIECQLHWTVNLDDIELSQIEMDAEEKRLLDSLNVKPSFILMGRAKNLTGSDNK